MPVFLLAAQPVAISLMRLAAKINYSVKMRASAEKWDSLWQNFVILAFLHVLFYTFDILLLLTAFYMS